MSVFSHFTKGIRIVDYRGYIHMGKKEKHREINLTNEYFSNKRRKPVRSNGERYKRIQVSDHALNRWNERVGPITVKETLEQIINDLFFIIRCGVHLVTKNVGVIDDDIVFTYYNDHDSIVISTFYGRKSLNIILNNFRRLRKFNKIEYEKIDLSIPFDILGSQLLPPIPIETMVFQGSRTDYYIEKYTSCGSSMLFVHVLSGEESGNIIKVDVSRSPSQGLSKSLLRAIFLMGYSDHVYQYIKDFKGEQLQKYLQKRQLHTPV